MTWKKHRQEWRKTTQSRYNRVFLNPISYILQFNLAKVFDFWGLFFHVFCWQKLISLFFYRELANAVQGIIMSLSPSAAKACDVCPIWSILCHVMKYKFRWSKLTGLFQTTPDLSSFVWRELTGLFQTFILV